MQGSLIFDIGCHIGEDSDFYLKKGFRVVAVEANPEMCAGLKRRFSNEIASGRFVLVEKAIAEQVGEVEFFVNEKESIWGTIRAEMAERNDVAFGAKSTKIIVPATTFESLIEEFGVPYYLKIDIEGADLLCLEGLLRFRDRPQFVSYENEKWSLSALCVEMNLLKKLGYTKFQIIDQGIIQKQRVPNPAKEGLYVDYQIQLGSSGLFGRELPGPWLSRWSAIARYLQIYANSKLSGILKRTPLSEQFVDRLMSSSWYNTHAAWHNQTSSIL